MYSYYYLFGLVLAFIVIYYVFYSEKGAVHSPIRRVRKKKMAEVRGGERVRISGKIVFAGRTLIAPLTHRRCVYYHVKVESNSNNKNIFSENIDIQEKKSGDVVIFDGEHYALINAKNAAAYVVKDERVYSGFWNETTPELKKFLNKHGSAETNRFGGSLSLMAQEGVWEEGEQLTVSGKAIWMKASDFKLKLPNDEILYIEQVGKQGVYITDDPYLDF